MKKIIIFALVMLTAFVCIGFAGEHEEELGIYQFPEIEPAIDLWGGFTLVDVEDSKQAGEYEYLHDSFSGGVKIYTFPFPHRIAFEAEVSNENDYFGEARYAYKDLVLTRLISRRLYHNLENINLIDLDTTTASPGVDIGDAGHEYGFKTDINKYFLRLKTPNFPLHLYTEGVLLTRKGTEQQRFLGGSAYYNSLQRASIDRDVDWKTQDNTIGLNTHLGPIEVDFSHSNLSFKPEGDEVLAYGYSGAGFPAGTLRGAGTYEHSRIPRLKGWSNSVRAHTMYTGKIVASTTLSKTHRENEFSGAETDQVVNYGELLWMPLTKLTFVTKYKYCKDSDSIPDSVTTPRSPISSKSTKVTGAVRYRPRNGLTLNAEYIQERKDRKDRNAEEWYLPKSLDSDTYSLSVASRILSSLKLRAKYLYREMDQETQGPAMGIVPSSSNEGTVSLTWTPARRVCALLHYHIAEDKKDDLEMVDSTGTVVNGADKRKKSMERLFGSVTFGLSENLSLTPSYTYIDGRIDQDLVYGGPWPPTAPVVDEGVENQSKGHHYAMNIIYSPMKNLDLGAQVSYTKSHEWFCPKNSDALNPISIASFSEVETKELTCEFEGTYEFKNQCSLSLSYRYTDLNDDSSDNPESGTYHLTQIMISKRWR